MCSGASFWGCFGAGRASPAAVPCLPGPAQPRSAQPSSPAGRLPQTWPFSQSCLESGGPSPASSGMPRVSRFCLQSSWGGASEVIKLAGKVLKAEKHSCRLQTPSPAAKCCSRVMLCASSLMSCGAQRLPPKGTTLLPSQKHSCFQSPSSSSCSCQTTSRSTVWYVPGEPLPVRDSGMLHRDTFPAPSQGMGSAGGAAEEGAGGTGR